MGYERDIALTLFRDSSPPMMAPSLYWLEQTQPSLRSLVGDTAFYLGLLQQQGYPVVPGLAIAASMHRAFFEQIDWADSLFADLPHSSLHVDVENSRQLQAIAQQIQQAIHATPFPADWQASIAVACQSFDSPTLVLRPSLALTGNPDPSLSYRTRDLLTTRTCTSDPVAIAQTVKAMWAELYRARSLFYWRRTGIPLQHIHLSILVQPLLAPLASGTLQSEGELLEIQARWGFGTALTWGDVPPDRYILHAPSGELRQRILARKRYAYSRAGEPPPVSPSSPHPESHMLRELLIQTPSAVSELQLYAVEAVYQEAAVLADSMLRQIAQMSQAIQETLSTDVWVEWMLSPTSSASEHAAALGMSDQVLHGLEEEAEEGPGKGPVTTTTETFHQGSRGETTQSRSIQLVQVVPYTPSPIYPSRLSSVADSARSESSPVESRGDDQPVPTERAQPSLLVGMGAASGHVRAPVWVVSDRPEAIAPIPEGHILVAKTIIPSWITTIQQSAELMAGLISEQGGMTSHAAILARELGIPAVVGVAQATQQLQTGDIVLMNGDRGTIQHLEDFRIDSPHRSSPSISRSGAKAGSTPQKAPVAANAPDRPAERSSAPGSSAPDFPSGTGSADRLRRLATSDRPTATQLMVSVSQPRSLKALDGLPIDGIGLLRSEWLMPSVLDRRSLTDWLESGQVSELISRTVQHLRPFVEAMRPRPVYYRSLDLRSQEFAQLLGDRAAVPEVNPLLGAHGTWSYVHNPAIFQAELAALRQIQAEGDSNLHLILPFVRTVEEFAICHRFIREAGLINPPFQVWIMAEVPSVLFLLKDYVAAGVQGIAIGTNDLTQLLLGVDRNHAEMGDAFNPRHPAVLQAVRQLIETARSLDIPCSVCGEAPGQFPDLVERLVQWGATAISVSPDAVMPTHAAIARAEKRLLLDGLRPSPPKNGG